MSMSSKNGFPAARLMTTWPLPANCHARSAADTVFARRSWHRPSEDLQPPNPRDVRRSTAEPVQPGARTRIIDRVFITVPMKPQIRWKLPGPSAGSRRGIRTWGFSASRHPFPSWPVMTNPCPPVCSNVPCSIANENLVEMQDLNIDRVDALIMVSKSALADKAHITRSARSFVQKFLRPMVGNLWHMNHDKEQLMMTSETTCGTIAPQITTWLGQRPQTA